jgi:hypothetical protein
MKKFFSGIICACTLALTSCHFSENVYINEDGSGTMEFKMDASDMMEMVAQMVGGESANGIDKAMDSTIVFKDFKMYMLMDPETKKMVFNFIYRIQECR